MVHFSQRELQEYDETVHRWCDELNQEFQETQSKFDQLMQRMAELLSKTKQNIELAESEFAQANAVYQQNLQALSVCKARIDECHRNISSLQQQYNSIVVPSASADDPQSQQKRADALAARARIQNDIAAWKRELEAKQALKTRIERNLSQCSNLISAIKESLERNKAYYARLSSANNALRESFGWMRLSFEWMMSRFEVVLQGLYNVRQMYIVPIYACFQEAGFRDLEGYVYFPSNGRELQDFCWTVKAAIETIETQTLDFQKECANYSENLQSGITNRLLNETDFILSHLNKMKEILLRQQEHLANAANLILRYSSFSM